MKTKLFYACAASALMLASCASEDLVSPNAGVQDGQAAMGFSMKTGNLTRDDKPLQDVNKDFGVWAIKANNKDGVEETNLALATTDNIVMKNYLVGYNDNDPYKAPDGQDLFLSPWFYEKLGYEDTGAAGNANSNNKNQYLKYWDGFFTNTYFFAYSPYLTNDRATDPITVNTPTFYTQYNGGGGTYPAIAYNKAISMSDNKEDVPMFATRREVNAGHIDGTNETVPMKFNHLFSKVKIAVYENIPGYRVELEPAFTDEGIVAYSANKKADNSFEDGTIVKKGKPIILFKNVDNAQDDFSPAVSYTDKVTDNVRLVFDLPTTNLVDGKYLDQDRNNRAPSATEYNVVPSTGNSGFQFVFNFKLVAEDTNEVIYVKNARAFVPADYTNWEPNKVYNYVFLITKNTSGNTTHTGPDDKVEENPAQALYPIVFDQLTIKPWTNNIVENEDFVVSE